MPTDKRYSNDKKLYSAMTHLRNARDRLLDVSPELRQGEAYISALTSLSETMRLFAELGQGES
ncbi:hypothetical protein V6615_14285 [Oscillospiraceae bacterium PP1C4]